MQTPRDDRFVRSGRSARLARYKQALLLIAALASAITGQFYFARKPDYLWDGLVFYGLAVLFFLALVAVPAPARASRQVATARRAGVARQALASLGLAFGLVVVVQVAQPAGSYWPAFWLWFVAAVLYLLAFARQPALSSPNRWRADASATALPPAQEGRQANAPLRAWLRANGWEWGVVLLVVMAAWLLRVWHVTGIPWTLSGDEGSQGVWARALLEGRVTDIFGLGWLSVPNMSFVWQAAWLRLAGDNVLGLRLPWTVVGALTVWGTYLLVRRLFDRWLALLAAVLLATYHFHIHFSRLGSNQIADPLFVVWALYFLVVGLQAAPEEPGSSRRWAWALSGMLAGLSFYAYAGARQLPLIMLILLGWAALLPFTLGSGPRLPGDGFFLRHRGNLLAMLGGFLLIFGPMALQALRYPDDFNSRLNEVGILQSGWLDRAMAATGRSRVSLMAEQVRRAFLAFNFYRDRVVWYGASIPLMDFASSIFFVLGAGYAISRLRPRTDACSRLESEVPVAPDVDRASAPSWAGWRYAVFVVWFVVAVGVGGALTENPPSSQRLVSSAVPAVFFVAVALRAVAGALGDLLGWQAGDRRLLAGGLALILGVLSLRYYFGPYQASWTYGGENAEAATRIGYYLRDLNAAPPTDAGPARPLTEYFFGAPRMYADFGSTVFIARGVTLRDVNDTLNEPPRFVDPTTRPVFIFLPERASEMSWVQRLYPGGAVEGVYRENDPRQPLLFMAYRVNP